MWFQVLFTVLSLCGSVCATIMALLARESAARAAHSEHRLAIQRGQVAGLEAAMMGLDEKHRKLAGRVYADEYWRGQREPLAPGDVLGAVALSGDPCENWTTAQREGPTSAAASCACPYCDARRADRASRRAKLRGGVKS